MQVVADVCMVAQQSYVLCDMAPFNVLHAMHSTAGICSFDVEIESIDLEIKKNGAHVKVNNGWSVECVCLSEMKGTSSFHSTAQHSAAIGGSYQTACQ